MQFQLGWSDLLNKSTSTRKYVSVARDYLGLYFKMVWWKWSKKSGSNFPDIQDHDTCHSSWSRVKIINLVAQIWTDYRKEDFEKSMSPYFFLG